MDLQFSVRFEGDENTYYVDGSDQVIWFNHLAEPIAFGRFGPSTQRGYEHELTWSGLQFQVDKAGLIWRRTAHDMSMRVGRLEVFRTP